MSGLGLDLEGEWGVRIESALVVTRVEVSLYAAVVDIRSVWFGLVVLMSLRCFFVFFLALLDQGTVSRRHMAWI
jgi:hypothetical protein